MATQQKREKVGYILGEPDLFPDEFKAWIPRMLEGNANYQLQQGQLPTVEATRYIGASGEPAFENSWVNYVAGYEEAGYWIDPFGVVHLVGLIKNGVIGSRAFQLPGGYRPKGRQIFVTIAGADSPAVRIDVTATGEVLPMAGTNGYVSISGITFRAFG